MYEMDNNKSTIDSMAVIVFDGESSCCCYHASCVFLILLHVYAYSAIMIRLFITSNMTLTNADTEAVIVAYRSQQEKILNLQTFQKSINPFQ